MSAFTLEGRLQEAYLCVESHLVQSQRETCMGSHLRASRDPVDCMPHMPRPILWLSLPSRLFRAMSQMRSILLGRHRSLQLRDVSRTWFNWTVNPLEFAFRNVAAEHSERPMNLVLPSFLISSRAGIDSSREVSERSQCRTHMLSRVRTWIDAVEIV